MIKRLLVVKSIILVDYVMIKITRDQNLKDAKLKQWIDIMLKKFVVEFVKLNNHPQMNVFSVEFNLQVIIVKFVNYMKMIKIRIYFIVINVKCVD